MSNETNNQFLTFSLGEEVYGIEVFKVREVLELIKITRVPRMPDFMLGVINLRGSVVPVIDLRIKLDLKPKEATQDTSIIILEIAVGEDMLLLGVYVDSVHEVMEYKAEELEPPPRIGTKVNNDFIQGVGKKQDEFMLILDISRVFRDIEETSIPLNEAGEGNLEEEED